MQEAGRDAVSKAKADGRWDAAYPGSADAEAPADLMDALKAVPSALATWEKLNKTNRYAIYLRVSSLKTATGRQKRIQAFVEMLAKGDMPVPQKGTMSSAAKKTTKSIDRAVVPAKANTRDVRQTRSGRKMPVNYG
jgi:hypothetical protein